MPTAIYRELSIAGSGNETLDVNLRQLGQEYLIILIDSDNDLTVDIVDGLGGNDDNQTTDQAVPTVLGGSAVPVYDGTAASYTVTGGTVKKILVERRRCGDWISLLITNLEGTTATVTIYGSVQ